MTKQTPSQQAKASGLSGIKHLSELTGVSYQTLSNWSKDKPRLFNIVLLGAREALK